MKLIFMGTPDFAVRSLRELVEAGHDVSLVVTQPDRQKGRGKTVQCPPVKEAASEYGIEVYQPQKVRRPECVEYLKKQNADMIIVAAFGQLLPKEILDLPPYGCVNVHASLLPKYRGASPIQWAVINGEKTAGVTIMQMGEGLDTGDILAQSSLPLAADETGGSLFDKLAEEGAKLLVKTLPHIEDGSVMRTPQNEDEATYVGMIKKTMGDIDWTRPAAEIERLVRGLNPWPSAYTVADGRTLKIWKAAVIPGGDADRAGEVICSGRDGLVVQTGGGQLRLLEVQLEGKKRMAADAFLRGYALAAGTKLGGKQAALSVKK